MAEVSGVIIQNECNDLDDDDDCGPDCVEETEDENLNFNMLTIESDNENNENSENEAGSEMCNILTPEDCMLEESKEKQDNEQCTISETDKEDKVHVLCDKDGAQTDDKMGQTAMATDRQAAVEEEDFCSICRDEHTEPKVLSKCSHSFCTDCIDEYFKIKPQCPMCFTAYGVITGNMPKGDMSSYVSTKVKLSGYESIGTIVIHYSFSDGTQTEEHPHPGQQYYGTSRTAYLPDNEEGRKVLRLLKASFNRRLTFTVGRSRTTGMDNCVTWNDIHHKTCPCGGQENFGYPDDTYLQRVQEELAAKGVTEESLKEYPDS